ncbi:hypothetical protein ACYFX5_24990 [Bremerella sp. T1]|uniref:hypothetical protein n=1 Tax=Bremerella sp. TYQ1 TaxID=3119568 RepID=UPI001CC9CB33|nr:hypothetical protein [Bremerella volcania]UBM36275.1 hypothetical protein LA756_26925 [Bremerella volcania]
MPTRCWTPLIALLLLTACVHADEKPSKDAPSSHWQTGSWDLKEIEKIREQLGPEFKVESKALGIQAEPASGNASTGDLQQEIREMVETLRQDARKLEALASQAESQNNFTMADKLREIGRTQWESARKLVAPAMPYAYSNPYSPNLQPPTATDAPQIHQGPTVNDNMYQSPTWTPNHSHVPYGPRRIEPSKSQPRFSVPQKNEAAETYQDAESEHGEKYRQYIPKQEEPRKDTYRFKAPPKEPRLDDRPSL